MFDFKKKTLNPLMANFLTRMDKAIAAPETAEKVERLLALRDNGGEILRRLAAREDNKMGVAMIVGANALVLALFAGVVTLPAGAALSAAAPLFTAGAAAMAAGLGAGVKRALNCERVKEDRGILQAKINGEVLRLAAAEPAEAMKSPRFMKALKDTFNQNADAEQDFAALAKRVAPAARLSPKV
jgi:hypothetical protein